MRSTITFQMALEVEESVVYSCSVTCKVYYVPGYISGPPEDCYPAEWDCDILSCRINGEAEIVESLSDSSLDQINDKAWEVYDASQNG